MCIDINIYVYLYAYLYVYLYSPAEKRTLNGKNTMKHIKIKRERDNEIEC